MTQRWLAALAVVFALVALAAGLFLAFTSVWDFVLRQYVGLDRLWDIESAAIVGCLTVPVSAVLLIARRPRAAAALYGLAALLWLVGFFGTGTYYNLANALIVIAIFPLPSLALAALSYLYGARATA